MTGNTSESAATGSEQTEAIMLQLPLHIARLAVRLSQLNEGRYIMTLTLNRERKAFWTIQEMGQIERSPD
jgi:hypothetical protein